MSDLPPEIARRNPWPSPEAIDKMIAKKLIPSMPQGWRNDDNRYTDWTADPVAIRAVAMLPDRMLETIETWLRTTTDFDSRVEQAAPPCDHDRHALMGLDAPADLMPLWTGVVSVTIIAWANARLICDISFMPPSDRATPLRYADSSLALGGDVPDQMRLAASGSPMDEMLPLPLFTGLNWPTEQESDTLINGPKTGTRLGALPGKRLVQLALEQRPAMLADARRRFG